MQKLYLHFLHFFLFQRRNIVRQINVESFVHSCSSQQTLQSWSFSLIAIVKEGKFVQENRQSTSITCQIKKHLNVKLFLLLCHYNGILSNPQSNNKILTKRWKITEHLWKHKRNEMSVVLGRFTTKILRQRKLSL